MTDTASISARLGDTIVEHVKQVLRDYDIPEDTIANDPEIASSTREVVADLLDRLLAPPEGLETSEETRLYLKAFIEEPTTDAETVSAARRDTIALLGDFDRLSAALAARDAELAAEREKREAAERIIRLVNSASYSSDTDTWPAMMDEVSAYLAPIFETGARRPRTGENEMNIEALRKDMQRRFGSLIEFPLDEAQPPLATEVLEAFVRAIIADDKAQASVQALADAIAKPAPAPPPREEGEDDLRKRASAYLQPHAVVPVDSRTTADLVNIVHDQAARIAELERERDEKQNSLDAASAINLPGEQKHDN